jgi:hypothetical protein
VTPVLTITAAKASRNNLDLSLTLFGSFDSALLDTHVLGAIKDASRFKSNNRRRHVVGNYGDVGRFIELDWIYILCVERD